MQRAVQGFCPPSSGDGWREGGFLGPRTVPAPDLRPAPNIHLRLSFPQPKARLGPLDEFNGVTKLAGVCAQQAMLTNQS